MKNKNYSFKENGMQFDINPQVAGEEIEKVKNQHGGKFKPEDVVVAAQSENNPLHDLFDWDNASAGHKHRIQTARILIGSIVVTYKHHEEVRANYSVRYSTPTKEDERAYTGVEEAVKPDYELQFTNEACNHLKTFVKRYQSFDYLQSSINEVKQIIDMLSKRVNELTKEEELVDKTIISN